jgi:hypothetical protein
VRTLEVAKLEVVGLRVARLDIGRLDRRVRTELGVMKAVVPEHGTTVVTVVSLSVVKVFCAVNGQFVIDSGHLVIVSTIVEINVDVVDDGSADVTGLINTLLLS